MNYCEVMSVIRANGKAINCTVKNIGRQAMDSSTNVNYDHL